MPIKKPSEQGPYCNRKCYTKHRTGVLRGSYVDRVLISGYWYLYEPGHHRANKRHYVAEHVLIMERSMGRRIDPNETVHHKDRNSQNNKLSNLELMTIYQHGAHHAHEMYKNSGGKKWIKE